MITDLIEDVARAQAIPAIKRAAGVVTRILPIPQPTMMVGPDSSARLGTAISDLGHKRLMVVTDSVITKLGLMKPLLDALKKGGTDFVVFDEVPPDAPIPVIMKGIDRYNDEGCDAILAFGGGSVMDSAKTIGVAVSNKKHPRDLVGYFRGWNGPPPLYAVPTTAGTGSEVTVAAVISDPENGTKLVIADTRIVPKMAALDPKLMKGLPGPITAATGMDALTHAVEAYIGYWGTTETDRLSLAAVGMIYENLPIAYKEGQNLHAREAMALASTYAGMAFTRANVGNVHAIAHQLGGKYHVPHGLANAIILPLVLRFSAKEVRAKLATLAVRARVGDPGEGEGELSEKFLESVENLNKTLGIPKHIEKLQEDDIPALAKAACWEADTNYPVPRRMSQRDCERILRHALPPKN
ncbi:MAG: iron-containing alcohol dehydrogenase [Thermoanaerobaculia bacterium]|nr:Alcohol dehydrogenase 2 [Thermoanaerobaculia bacterium]MCK6683560.1 iron-containing alcohol dehydrogenase [Thermoanaerobaculia bacterium]